MTVVDGTVCPIRKPADKATEELFYSGKHKEHVVKYIVCISITTGLVCYVSEAFPGSVHDKLCLELCGVADRLSDGAGSCLSTKLSIHCCASETFVCCVTLIVLVMRRR